MCTKYSLVHTVINLSRGVQSSPALKCSKLDNYYAILLKKTVCKLRCTHILFHGVCEIYNAIPLQQL
jgi:hypothetical protein